MDKVVELYMPVAGQIIPLSEINDYLIENTVDGAGVGIIPNGDIFFAPVSGKVVMVSDTLNSVAIQTKNNITILIHGGMDTAKLEGRGFGMYVRTGDKVTVGDKLFFMDRDYVELTAKLTTPLIITTPHKIASFNVDYDVKSAFVKFMDIHVVKE